MIKNKPLGSIVIYNENNKEDHKEHVINDLNDLENFKDETILRLYLGKCEDLDSLVKLTENFRILDSLSIFYLGNTKDYHLLPHFHKEGFDLQSYKNLDKVNIQKLNATKISKVRSLCLHNYPIVCKKLNFLQNFIKLRSLSLTIYADKDENVLDLSELGKVKINIYEGISNLNLDFRFFPLENKISIASLSNSEHIERLCLMSNFFHDLKDLEVLTKMKKLKSLYILDWNDLDNLESLLESASLKEIYLGSNIYEKYFGLLGNKFEEKNIKVLKTDLNRTKIFV